MELPDPNQPTPERWMASCIVKFHLVVALWGWTDFLTINHVMLFQEGRLEICQRNDQNLEQGLLDDL